MSSRSRIAALALAGLLALAPAAGAIARPGARPADQDRTLVKLFACAGPIARVFTPDGMWIAVWVCIHPSPLAP